MNQGACGLFVLGSNDGPISGFYCYLRYSLGKEPYRTNVYITI